MNYYELIKQELINNEVYKKVKDYSKNRSDLRTYYNVGKMLVEAQGGEVRAKYGDGLIKEYSQKLMKEIDNKYNYRNLMHMRKFYLVFKEEIVYALRTQLTWTHYREIIGLNNINKIKYYIDICSNQNLSYRELHNRIKSNEYERLDDKTKLKLKDNNKLEINDLVKNPIIIKSNIDREKITEKVLHNLILENITSFMKELGDSFSFIESEYKIKVDNRYNYIDLLLYNIDFNCYVVVELKVTELKKEHVGQIMTYMNYIDKKIKKISQDKTIGIIITRKDNKYVMEYCSDPRIFNTTYLLQGV